MKDITYPDDLNKYYMYKGYFIERHRHNGMYSCFGENGYLKADTQRGMKRLINDEISKTKTH